MSARKTVTLMAVLGLLAAGAAQAAKLDMTGSWIGSTPCTQLEDGECNYLSFTNVELLIVQDGDRLRMSAFGVVYEGIAQSLSGGANDERWASPPVVECRSWRPVVSTIA